MTFKILLYFVDNEGPLEKRISSFSAGKCDKHGNLIF
jgi:hypothetical protein